MLHRLLTLARRDGGAAIVEFAVVAGIFAVIIFGLIEFGFVYYEKNLVSGAARDGSRYALVRSSTSGHPADTGVVSAYVRGRTQLTPIKVTTTWPQANVVGKPVHVQVQYTHKLLSPIVGFVIADSVVLSSTSRMTISY